MATSINIYKKQTGLAGLVNDYIELSTRVLKDKLKETNISIDELSKEYSLSIGFIPDDISTRIVKMFIVNIHSFFENFLLQVIKDPALDLRIDTFNKNFDDSLSWLFKTLFGNSGTRQLRCLYRVCDYYRLIRNKIVHCENDKDKGRINEDLTYLKKYSKYFTSTKSGNVLSLPNSINKLTFNDYITYQRCSIDLAIHIYDNLPFSLENIFNSYESDLVRIIKKYHQSKETMNREAYNFLSRIYPKKLFSTKHFYEMLEQKMLNMGYKHKQ